VLTGFGVEHSAILIATQVSYAMSVSKKVLLVSTSCGAFPGDDGKPTGFWLDEVAHPFVKLSAAGIAVDVASIKGGKAPCDPGSFKTDAGSDNAKFWGEMGGEKIMSETKALASVDAADYDGVVFCGGHGTCFDFPGNAEVQRVAKAVWEKDGVVAAVCHG
jgi:putative intracellular protease/amidase